MPGHTWVSMDELEVLAEKKLPKMVDSQALPDPWYWQSTAALMEV